LTNCRQIASAVDIFDATLGDLASDRDALQSGNSREAGGSSSHELRSGDVSATLAADESRIDLRLAEANRVAIFPLRSKHFGSGEWRQS